MKLQEIRKIAKSRGIEMKNLKKKADLIRAIQGAEGNFDCYGSAFSGFCDQVSCIWKEDCLIISRRRTL